MVLGHPTTTYLSIPDIRVVGHKGGYLGSVRGRRVSERETDSQSKYLSQSVRENRAYRAPPEEELKMGALLYIYSAFMFYNMHGKNFNKNLNTTIVILVYQPIIFYYHRFS